MILNVSSLSCVGGEVNSLHFIWVCLCVCVNIHDIWKLNVWKNVVKVNF